MEKFLKEQVHKNIIPAISEFIKIPNQSRLFDPNWNSNGLQERACQFAIDFAKKQNIKDMSIDFIQEEGKTPALLAIVEASPGKFRSL
jgi:hypothetical protein